MIQNKKVVGITLARGGSKRVPNKNMALINGKPLLQYTIDEVKKSKYIDEYIVSSDSEDILLFAKSLGCKTIKRLSVEDTQTSADGLIKTLVMEYGFDELGKDAEDFIVVEIMATNPLKIVDDIDNTIEQLFKGDSSVSVVRIWDNHPSRVKMIDEKTGGLKDFWPEIPESRRQDLTPAAYVRNGSVYVMWWKSLITKRMRLHGNIVPYIMPEERTINIDEPIDLELAKLIISQK